MRSERASQDHLGTEARRSSAARGGASRCQPTSRTSLADARASAARAWSSGSGWRPAVSAFFLFLGEWWPALMAAFVAALVPVSDSMKQRLGLAMITGLTVAAVIGLWPESRALGAEAPPAPEE